MENGHAHGVYEALQTSDADAPTERPGGEKVPFWQAFRRCVYGCMLVRRWFWGGNARSCTFTPLRLMVVLMHLWLCVCVCVMLQVPRAGDPWWLHGGPGESPTTHLSL